MPAHLMTRFVSPILLLPILLSTIPKIQAQRSDIPTLTNEEVDAIVAQVDPLREEFQVPGAAVAIFQGDDIVYVGGHGVRKVDTGEPITTQTVFRVGSTTKAMTSFMIATLVDDGVIDWDTLAVEVYPDFRLPTAKATQSVTIADLMGMGTGFQGVYQPFLWETYKTAQDIFAAIAAQPTLDKPGYSYNNEIYASAGHLGAIAADSTYAALMQERVFDSVGMSTAQIGDSPAAVSDDWAQSYIYSIAGELATATPEPYRVIGSLAPSGAVISNVNDLARFVITVKNSGITPNGTRVVSQDALVRTITGQTPIDNDAAYAMGWIVDNRYGYELVHHEGNIDGYYSYMAFVPDADAGLVILTNSIIGELFIHAVKATFLEQLYPGSTADEVVTLRETYGQQYEVFTQIAPLLNVPVPVDTVAPFLGEYENGYTLEWRPDETLWLIRGKFEIALLPGDNIGLANTYVLGNTYLAYANFVVQLQESKSGDVALQFFVPGVPEELIGQTLAKLE
ncbi:MAG: beta-lactamase family protein [Chloroflexi bacterium]|nr:beta-lactamase family protein [Chloroflexota bacterium]